jgi:Zn-dependent protease with chaperone function
MRSKLFIASLWTLTLLFGMVAAIVLLALYSQGSISVAAVFILTILINIVSWLFSPLLTDWIQKFFYKAQYYDESDFKAVFPQYAAYLNQACQKNNIPFPKIGFIPDDNPTAFSYGSGQWNSRIVFTQGIQTYLEEDEAEAVLAHELGHIAHRDFIVMSIANAIIQLLYELYYVLARADKKGKLAPIGWLAYIFYFIGTYIVLYLNRLREYYADEFSAENTNPVALENALVKVAYGIMAKEDTSSGARLLESTKTMGIMSLATAKSAGLAMKVTNMAPDKVARVMLFDVVSPWAKLAQISATHPLTGRRLKTLETIAASQGKPSRFDLDAARNEAQIDKGKLWGGFFFGAFMYLLPWLVFLGALALGFIFRNSNDNILPYLIGGTALALLVTRIFYRYPSIKNSQPDTIYNLMTDIYANPVRGRPVQMEGEIVGRGVPGYIFSEDMMMQDKTGLLYIDYQGGIPLFSNLMFALKKLKALIGSKINAQGWFFRSNVQLLRLKKIEAGGGKTFKSYPRLWGLVGSIILAAFLGLMVGAIKNVDATSLNDFRQPHSSASIQAGPEGVGTTCYAIPPHSYLTVTSPKPCEARVTVYKQKYTDESTPILYELDIKPMYCGGSFPEALLAWSKDFPLSSPPINDTSYTIDGLSTEEKDFNYSSDTIAIRISALVDTGDKITVAGSSDTAPNGSIPTPCFTAVSGWVADINQLRPFQAFIANLKVNNYSGNFPDATVLP